MDARAIQDEIGPENGCYGCGPENPDGLRLKTYWEGEETVSRFTPRPSFAAGPPDVLNGGIVATVIDCHGVCTAVASVYRLEGRPIGSEPRVWCVTASLAVKYLKPTPLDGELLLRGRVASVEGKKTRVAVSLWAAGVERAQGEVLAIRVR
jgi:acyl-coenzyme A thioesterase PaaI-like protein